MRSVGADAVLTHPELIAVSEFPVGGFVHGIVNLFRGRFKEIFSGDELASVRDSAVEKKLGELCDVFGFEIQSPAAFVGSFRTALPHAWDDVEGIEDAGHEVFAHVFAGDFADGRREHVSCGGVVGETGSGFKVEFGREEAPDPVAVRIGEHRGGGAGGVSACHGQQIAESDFAHPRVGDDGIVFREKGNHCVAEAKQPFALGNADGAGGEAFAEREEGMGDIG